MNIEKYIQESIQTKEAVLGDKNIIVNTEKAIELIKKCFAKKGKMHFNGQLGNLVRDLTIV